MIGSFDIMDSILLEDSEELLMAQAAKRGENGFMVFRPVIVERFPNGDALIDAVLAIVDSYEDKTGYGYAKVGLFLINKDKMVFAKPKEDKDLNLIRLYEQPFSLENASTKIQTLKLVKQALYNKNTGIVFETENEIQKEGNNFVTTETESLVVEKTRNSSGIVLETKIYELLPSGRKSLLIKWDGDLAKKKSTEPGLDK